MGQATGSWCISYSLSSFIPPRRKKEFRKKAISGCLPWCIRGCVCMFTMLCVSVSICEMILLSNPRDTPAIFALHFSSIAIDPNTESVEDLMQRFQDSFRVPNTPTDMSHYQHVMHSSSTGRRRVPSHTRGRTVRVYVSQTSYTRLSVVFATPLHSSHFERVKEERMKYKMGATPSDLSKR